jgi:hypothetical protein
MRKIFQPAPALFARLLPILLMASGSAAAQPMSSVVKAQAMEMGRALVAQDVETFGKYMHPALVQKAGGPGKMREMADTMTRVFKQFGASVNRILIGNPTAIVAYKKTIQTTLPQTTYLVTSFVDIELESTLVAISMDGGKQWYFIDTNIYRTSELRKDLPELSPALVIPPASKPKIIPKEQ